MRRAVSGLLAALAVCPGAAPSPALVLADHGMAAGGLGFASAGAPSKHDPRGVVLHARGGTAPVREPCLLDVAPTVLGLLGRETPAELEGRAVLSAVS